MYAGQALGHECAVKVYRRTTSTERLQAAMSEIQLAASLDHPFCLRLLYWTQHPLQAMTELCLGDLQAYYKDKIPSLLYAEMKTLSLLQVCCRSSFLSFLFYSVPFFLPSSLIPSCLIYGHFAQNQETASGLLYIHNVGIIHRDIKPGNILIGKKTLNAKIADYGISRVSSESTMSSKGTMIYTAPEVSRGERYGFAADVYSFALTMYELCDRVGLDGAGKGRSEGCGQGAEREGGRGGESERERGREERDWTSLNALPFPQKLPFARSDRARKLQLAIEIAEDGHRPEIREAWNPSLSFLITSCWCGNPALRPHLHYVIEGLSAIMKGGRGLITALDKPEASKGMGSLNHVDFYLAPGALWRRARIGLSQVQMGKVLGAG